MKTVAMYCDRQPRGGIGNYSRELYARMEDAELAFLNQPGTELNFEGKIYPVLHENELLEAKLHHGTDVSLSWLVPKVKKSVITLHDLTIDGQIVLTGTDAKYIQGYTEYLKRADRIIFDSYDSMRRATPINLDEDKQRVVYLGVDSNQFRPLKNKEQIRANLINEVPELKELGNSPIITSVCIDEDRKNIQHVIRALSKARETEDIKYVHIGYPGRQQRDETKALIKELNLTNHISYINTISRDQIAALYNISVAHVLPTNLEGFCLAFSEAMASGCPVIAYNTTTAPEVVGPGGILVDYPDEGENIEGLAEAILKLTSDKKAREEKARRAIAHAKKFKWEDCAANTLKVYNELL